MEGRRNAYRLTHFPQPRTRIFKGHLRRQKARGPACGGTASCRDDQHVVLDQFRCKKPVKALRRDPRIITSSKAHHAADSSRHDRVIKRPEGCPPTSALHILYILMGKPGNDRYFVGNITALFFPVGIIINSGPDNLSRYLFSPVLVIFDMRSALYLCFIGSRDHLRMELL